MWVKCVFPGIISITRLLQTHLLALSNGQTHFLVSLPPRKSKWLIYILRSEAKRNMYRVVQLNLTPEIEVF